MKNKKPKIRRVYIDAVFHSKLRKTKPHISAREQLYFAKRAHIFITSSGNGRSGVDTPNTCNMHARLGFLLADKLRGNDRQRVYPCMHT